MNRFPPGYGSIPYQPPAYVGNGRLPAQGNQYYSRPPPQPQTGYPAGYYNQQPPPSAQMNQYTPLQQQQQQLNAQQATNAEEAFRVQEKFGNFPPLLTATSPQYNAAHLTNCKVHLFPHQLTSIQRIMDADEYITRGKMATEIWNGDECGSGKTYALLGAIAALKRKALANSQKKVAALVIVPQQVIFQWQRSIRDFGADLTQKTLETYSDLTALNYSVRIFHDFDIILISIEQYPHLQGTLSHRERILKVVIVDEVDGVADFQSIDCAHINGAEGSLQPLGDAPSQGLPQRKQVASIKTIPAQYVIRVSASMKIPDSVREKHPVTIVRNEKSFIAQSLKLEAPFKNTIRCQDIYIHSVLRHFLTPAQQNAMHALDFKSALRGYQGRGSSKINDALDVMKTILNSYRKDLEFNENIIQEYISAFPYLEQLNEVYGTEIQTLLRPSEANEGDMEVRYAPAMSLELRNKMSELFAYVLPHICEKFDEVKQKIKQVQATMLKMRTKMFEAGLCPGGECKTLLNKHERVFATPCCSMHLCLGCFESHQGRTDMKQGLKCMLCRKNGSVQQYQMMATAHDEDATDVTQNQELIDDKKTALLNIIVGRKEELREAREAAQKKRLKRKRKAESDDEENTDAKEDDNDVKTLPPVAKFLVGSGFSEIFMTMEEELKKVGITTAYLESGSAKQTDEICRKFWETEEIDVLFCQLSNVGSSVARGLNLQCGTDLIFFERPSSAMEEQLRGRLQRIGRPSRLQEWLVIHEFE